MRWLAIALTFVAWPFAARSQTPAPQTSKSLVVGTDRLSFLRANVSLPIAPGAMILESAHEFDAGGLDASVQYLTPDKAISGSAFVYFPGLADTGLTFLATDAIIRSRFGPRTQIVDDRLVAVAGVSNAGRRVVYSGASEGRRTTAALFVRVGGWIIVLRASGPASRTAEVLAQLDAMADGLKFAGKTKPEPARIVRTTECLAGDKPDATVSVPDSAFVMAASMIVVGDHPSLSDERSVRLAAIPDEMCLVATSTAGSVITLDYRPSNSAKNRQTVQWVRLTGDAGLTLVAMSTLNDAKRISIVRYTTGGYSIYATFDGLPSRKQLDTMANRDASLAQTGEGTFDPEGDSKINIFCNRTKEGCMDSKTNK